MNILVARRVAGNDFENSIADLEERGLEAGETVRLSRRDLSVMQREALHVSRNWTKAEVYVVEWPAGSGRRVVVKDMISCPLWFRMFVTRRVLRREWAALTVLKGLAGVPKPLARPDADALVMERLEGTVLRSIEKKDVPPTVVERVKELVEACHERGVTHGDLHSANVLLTAGDGVAIIDWATACVFGPHKIAQKNWTWKEWSSLDRRAVSKMRSRFSPVTMTEEDWMLLRGGTPLARVIRSIGNRIKPGKRNRRKTRR